MRPFIVCCGLLIVLIALPIALAERTTQETDGVYIQALQSANLRSGPGTEYDQITEILAGTDYRVIQQHALVPWMLIEVPESPYGAGWVYNDLVQVTRGNLNTVPYTEDYEELTLRNDAATPTPPSGSETPALVSTEEGTEAEGTATPVSDAPLNTAVPALNVVTARLTGDSYIRYAPGTEYPIIDTFVEGTLVTVLARHEVLPWYKVAIETSPNGAGWIFQDVVEIQGDVFTLPVIRETTFSVPTPNYVVVQQSPFDLFENTGTSLAASLGDTLQNYLLSQQIVPRSNKEASIFVMDLQTNEHFTLNEEVAYSGMSISKIAILLSYFLHQNDLLDTDDAELLATTMICSENITTNEMITVIGDGDILQGAQRVTENLKTMGLGNSYIVSPYDLGLPDPTPVPVSPLQTNVDQSRTQPDMYNQITVEEMGWLLGSLYTCAKDGTGPLIEAFADKLTELECRQMIRLMSANHVGRLLEVAVSPGAVVAHKHGWIDNTFGDAGIVFGPESTYVVAMVYNDRTTFSGGSISLLEEVARQIWNHFNPSYSLEQTVTLNIPAECNIYGEPVIAEMLSGNLTLPSPGQNATPTPSP
jgi:uncharacterized protein YgiM (DUF1202 family)